MDKITKQIIFITATFILLSCNSRKSEDRTFDSKADNQILKTTEKEINEVETTIDLLTPKEVVFDGYIFKFGYKKYDEEQYGFSNPGYLQVLKDRKTIYTDTFGGEGEVYVQSLGHHELSGDKLIFTLNWGTEACDYIQTSRYFSITPEGKVQYLNEYWSANGGDGYSSRFYNHIFPKDPHGRPDSILIVEGHKFHEHDQPDLYDTTYISFEGDTCRISKPTNNLDKAK